MTELGGDMYGEVAAGVIVAEPEEWRCQECNELFSLSVGEGEGTASDVSGEQEAQESWMHLIAPRGSGQQEGAQRRADVVDTTHLEETRWVLELPGGDREVHTYPLCEACTLRFIQELGAARDLARQECDVYEREYARLLGEGGGEEEGGGNVEERLREAEEEERELLEKAKVLEHERSALRGKIEELQGHAIEVELTHEAYWREYNNLHMLLRSNERDSLRRKIETAKQQLEALNKTNVINDAFFISHSDVYGTINGFRLGSIQAAPVVWDEINAAWGQTVLLLQTLATNCDFSFSRYRLVPMGSFSRILKREDDKAVFDLYCPADIGYGTFDKGMAGFLECVKELQDHVHSIDAGFSPPYRIEEDRIENLSVKLQFNTYEKWTRALKYMLTNIKWLVASRIQ